LEGIASDTNVFFRGIQQSVVGSDEQVLARERREGAPRTVPTPGSTMARWTVPFGNWRHAREQQILPRAARRRAGLMGDCTASLGRAREQHALHLGHVAIREAEVGQQGDQTRASATLHPLQNSTIATPRAIAVTSAPTRFQEAPSLRPPGRERNARRRQRRAHELRPERVPRAREGPFEITSKLCPICGRDHP